MSPGLGALLIGLLAGFAGPDWRPDKNPDPEVILNEAEADARAGRYRDALAKHVWFHEHALEYKPGMYGVRLSFALGAWVNLGKAYPPALQKLKAVRNAAAENARDGADQDRAFHSFHDFAAINSALAEEAKTTQLFLWLDGNRPGTAARMFDVAEPALIKAREYELCGKYLQPDLSFDQIVHLYHINKELASDPEHGKAMKEYSEKAFANSTATLVALLVVNGLKKDAERIVLRAEAESSDPGFRELLQKARQGEVPTPWP